MKKLFDILPVYGMEHDTILSKMGDVTIAFRVQLPEIFTLSNDEYEAFHHGWIKAIKVLPVNSILCKQDWFTEASYKSNFKNGELSFLSRSSERFFNERPYLDHECFILITQKPASRKPASSVFSSLLRKSIVPRETLEAKHLLDFLNHVGQFEKILTDTGFVQMERLDNNGLMNLLLQYLNLQSDGIIIRDIQFKDDFRIGEKHCQLFTLADAEFVPALCGSRINYDKYSTDKKNLALVLPLRLDSCSVAIIFTASMYSSKTCKKPCSV
jgi:hypothetical protein